MSLFSLFISCLFGSFFGHVFCHFLAVFCISVYKRHRRRKMIGNYPSIAFTYRDYLLKRLNEKV